MNCRNEKGYCQKIYDKVGREIFVDDNGCAKCDGNPKMPGIMPPIKQQLKNATVAAGRIAKEGLKIRDKIEQQKYFKICLNCEFLVDKTLKRCSECGCCLSLKTRLETEHCPKGKW